MNMLKNKITLLSAALCCTSIAFAQTTYPSGATLENGSDLVLQAGATRWFDPGDVVFKLSDGTEVSRIYSAVPASLWFARGPSVTPSMVINDSGNVGIGTTQPVERLSVNGKIRAHEIKVETANWPDYVFKPGYKPMSLSETAAFIRKYGHLPEVPVAATVEKGGLELGEMNKILLKKIEELTLHLIKKDEEITAMKAEFRQEIELLKAKK